MNRLSDSDKNFGPITIGKWHRSFAFYLEGSEHNENQCALIATGFGRAVRFRLPFRIKSFGSYGEHQRRYGFSLSDMGAGYDFFQLYYGPQTHDSSTTKSWCKHLPWKMWRHVRHSYYSPDGSLFYTQPKGVDYMEALQEIEKLPRSYFLAEDYDGERIVVTCYIEEMEWLRGCGWFKWLSWFSKPKVRRSLDIHFSSEVGCEKGTWKGGVIGHGIEMYRDELPEDAFVRYCQKDHRGRHGRTYRINYLHSLSKTDAEYLRNELAKSKAK